NLDILVRQGGLGGTPSPNGGQLFTVSPLGVNTQDAAALAIAPAGNQAFAALTLVGETTSRLFTINLAPATFGTAAATQTGPIVPAGPIRGLTVLPAGVFQFSAAAYSVADSARTATITVTRTGGSEGTATVNFATSNGTAVVAMDYTATSGVLTFNPGET